MAARRVVIAWFRKGLRVHDAATLAALDAGTDALVPVFVLDPHFVAARDRVGRNRWGFLLESLAALDAALVARGSRLVVAHGDPRAVLPALWRATGARELRFEYDFEPYARERDAAVRAAAVSDGLAVRVTAGHMLYDTERLVETAGPGRVPRTYESFRKFLATAMGEPPRPVDAPRVLPPLPALFVAGPCAPSRAAGQPSAESTAADWAVAASAALGGVRVGGPPSFAELFAGEPAPTTPIRGGEAEALGRLAAYLADAARVRAFAKPSGDPFALTPPSTTALSAHLKFGTLSARRFYWELMAIEKNPTLGGAVTQPPVSLRGQLLWREFFSSVAADVGPAFERIDGNPICRPIAWAADPPLVAAWAVGRTGFPLIDAVMRQLDEWGWMHHLARHIVACFLTRGDLWQSWLAGRDVFDRLLIDADWALNNANWMWLSCSAFYSQYWRVYSPVSFGDKYPSARAYVRHFVPELAALPDAVLMAPWNATREQLARARVELGVTYPHRIVDHDIARVENMARIKAAFGAAVVPADGARKRKRADASSESDDGGDERELKRASASARKRPKQAGKLVQTTLKG